MVISKDINIRGEPVLLNEAISSLAVEVDF